MFFGPELKEIQLISLNQLYLLQFWSKKYDFGFVWKLTGMAFKTHTRTRTHLSRLPAWVCIPLSFNTDEVLSGSMSSCIQIYQDFLNHQLYFSAAHLLDLLKWQLITPNLNFLGLDCHHLYFRWGIVRFYGLALLNSSRLPPGYSIAPFPGCEWTKPWPWEFFACMLGLDGPKLPSLSASEWNHDLGSSLLARLPKTFSWLLHCEDVAVPSSVLQMRYCVFLSWVSLGWWSPGPTISTPWIRAFNVNELIDNLHHKWESVNLIVLDYR